MAVTELIIILLLAFGVFITRITGLLNIPIFTDEAIYIRWAQIGLHDPAHRFISLTDGKQPLMTWLMYPFLMLFDDPLFAGRFVSVLSAVAAVAGIYFLGRELFGKKTAVFASLVYAFSPFTLLYDRLALMDSLLSAFGIWSVFLTVKLIRNIKLDTAMILGIIIGMGLLTKSSALFYFLLLPFSLLLFDFKLKNSKFRLAKWFGLVILAGIFSQVMYNTLRLSPWFYIIGQKNNVFIMSYPEFLQNGLRDYIPHLHGLFNILTGYLTVPLSVLLLTGITAGIIKKRLKEIYLLLLFLFPFLIFGAFAKIIFPRFILFMVMPLIVLAGKYFADISDYFKNRQYFSLAIFFIIMSFSARSSYYLIVDPVKADIPVTDRNQYLNDWPSGYGVKEVVRFLKEEAKSGKVVIATEGTFGLFPSALEIYLQDNTNIVIKSYWPVSSVPEELVKLANDSPVFMVFKETQEIPPSWPLSLVAKYPRGKGNTFLLFYQVRPED